MTDDAVTEAILKVLPDAGEGMFQLEVFRAVSGNFSIYSVRNALGELVTSGRARAEGEFGSLRYWRVA